MSVRACIDVCLRVHTHARVYRCSLLWLVWCVCMHICSDAQVHYIFTCSCEITFGHRIPSWYIHTFTWKYILRNYEDCLGSMYECVCICAKMWASSLRGSSTWLVHVCDMTHLFATLVTHMCDLSKWYLCDVTHSYLRHDLLVCVTWLICATWLIHMCDMTHPYMRHDSSIYAIWLTLCATWSVHMCDMTYASVRHYSFICATRHIHMCNTDHWYVRPDLLICATRPIHMCDMPHSYTQRDAIICATWLTLMHIMTYSHVQHASLIRATCPTHPCNMTCSCARHAYPKNIYIYIYIYRSIDTHAQIKKALIIVIRCWAKKLRRKKRSRIEIHN